MTGAVLARGEVTQTLTEALAGSGSKQTTVTPTCQHPPPSSVKLKEEPPVAISIVIIFNKKGKGGVNNTCLKCPFYKGSARSEKIRTKNHVRGTSRGFVRIFDN